MIGAITMGGSRWLLLRLDRKQRRSADTLALFSDRDGQSAREGAEGWGQTAFWPMAGGACSFCACALRLASTALSRLEPQLRWSRCAPSRVGQHAAIGTAADAV